MNFSRYIGTTPTIIIPLLGMDCKDVAVAIFYRIVAITYKATDTLMAGVESSCAECAQKHNAACAIKNAGFIDGTQLSKIQNMKPSAANTSGCRGVSFNKKTLRWEAQIKFRGKRTRLGSYKNFDDAVLVRKKAEQAIFGEFLDSLALESKKDE